MSKSRITFLIILSSIINFYQWAADAKPPLANPGVPDAEQITYGVWEDGIFNTWTDTVRRVDKNGVSAYEWGNKIIIRADDFRPISVNVVDEQGQPQISIDYTDQKAHVVIPSKKINRWIDVPEDAYDMLTLFYALRGFPFERKKKVKFHLVMPKPRVMKVSLALVGKENVTVRAGTFLCYKLRMQAGGLLGRFYKKRWYFVKIT